VARGTVVALVEGGEDAGSAAPLLYPVVTFKPRDGKAVEFVSHEGSRSAGHRKGAKVRVRYDPASPYNAWMDSFLGLWGRALAFGSAGAGFALAGACLALWAEYCVRRLRWVRKHGLAIGTEFHAVTRGQPGPDGSQPYHIVTRWHDPVTGRYHTFQSEDVAFDPEPVASIRSLIVVRIDPRNPRRHSMDTSFLPHSR
jgi:hypothetical protein